jgi:hypothetical protein
MIFHIVTVYFQHFTGKITEMFTREDTLWGGKQKHQRTLNAANTPESPISLTLNTEG